MEKKSLIRFDETDLELLSSEKELSEINGGKNVLTTIMESLGIDIDGNCGSGGCNNCNCH